MDTLHQETRQSRAVRISDHPSFQGLKSLLISLYSPMHSNCSPFLSAPPCHFLAALAGGRFPLFGPRRPRAGFRTDIRPAGCAKGKDFTVFLGSARPSPRSEDTCRRPGVSHRPFPRGEAFGGSKEATLNADLGSDVLSIQWEGTNSPKIKKPGLRKRTSNTHLVLLIHSCF